MNLLNTPIGNITSVTGYKYFKNETLADDASTPFELLDLHRETHGEQFSEELRTALDWTKSIQLCALPHLKPY